MTLVQNHGINFGSLGHWASEDLCRKERGRGQTQFAGYNLPGSAVTTQAIGRW